MLTIHTRHAGDCDHRDDMSWRRFRPEEFEKIVAATDRYEYGGGNDCHDRRTPARSDAPNAKSTLIGRLLYETHGVYEDQLQSASASRACRRPPAGSCSYYRWSQGGAGAGDLVTSAPQNANLLLPTLLGMSSLREIWLLRHPPQIWPYCWWTFENASSTRPGATFTCFGCLESATSWLL